MVGFLLKGSVCDEVILGGSRIAVASGVAQPWRLNAGTCVMLIGPLEDVLLPYNPQVILMSVARGAPSSLLQSKEMRSSQSMGYRRIAFIFMGLIMLNEN